VVTRRKNLGTLRYPRREDISARAVSAKGEGQDDSRPSPVDAITSAPLTAAVGTKKANCPVETRLQRIGGEPTLTPTVAEPPESPSPRCPTCARQNTLKKVEWKSGAIYFCPDCRGTFIIQNPHPPAREDA
jgi:hypothetical protein